MLCSSANARNLGVLKRPCVTIFTALPTFTYYCMVTIITYIDMLYQLYLWLPSLLSLHALPSLPMFTCFTIIFTDGYIQSLLSLPMHVGMLHQGYRNYICTCFTSFACGYHLYCHYMLYLLLPPLLSLSTFTCFSVFTYDYHLYLWLPSLPMVTIFTVITCFTSFT